MQQNKDRHLIRVFSNSRQTTPYSRRLTNSSYGFNGRMYDRPKGRIHNPNSSASSTEIVTAADTKEIIMNTEGYFMHENERQQHCENMNISCNRKVQSQKIESFTMDSFFENSEDYNETFQSRFPLQMISNLSLIEANALAFRNESETRRNIFISKGKTEQKVTSENAERKSKQVPDVLLLKRREQQLRLLTGTVEKVIYWFKLKNHFHLLFEVIALLIDVKRGKSPSERWLLLKDEKTGPSLQVIYYEIDRPLTELKKGAVVKCIGRLTSRNSLQAFKVEESSDEEKNESQRLFFISNLAAEEALANITKK